MSLLQHSSTSDHQDRTIEAGLINAPVLLEAGLRAVLEAHSERLVVRAARDGEIEGFDVVIAGPGHDPVPEHCLRALQRTALIGLGWECAPEGIDPALARRARAVLPLDTPATRLVQAMDEAMGAVRLDAVPGRAHRVGPGAPLSLREHEVLELISQGLSNQEIADRLFLSINSVKTYVRTAYRKIGVTRRSQAVLWGLRHGC